MLPEWLHQNGLRLKALLLRRRFDRDLDDEIAFHLAMREEKIRSAGIDAGADSGTGDARSGAMRQFGNPTHLKEACRAMWTFNFWESVWHDLNYGVRTLRNSPG